MHTSQILEWTATALSLGGSALMSTRYWKASEYIAWPLWLIAGLLLISLFTLTGQDGLLFGQVVGLVSTSLGLSAVVLRTNPTATRVICRISLGCALALSGMAIWAVHQALGGGLYQLEWVSATMACCASFLLASRSSVSGFAWLLWVAANGIGIVTSLYREQYGLVCLNVVFSCINVVGVWRWLGPALLPTPQPNIAPR